MPVGHRGMHFLVVMVERQDEIGVVAVPVRPGGIQVQAPGIGFSIASGTGLDILFGMEGFEIAPDQPHAFFILPHDMIQSKI